MYMNIKHKYKKKIITCIGNTDILEHSTLNINRDLDNIQMLQQLSNEVFMTYYL